QQLEAGDLSNAFSKIDKLPVKDQIAVITDAWGHMKASRKSQAIDYSRRMKRRLILLEIAVKDKNSQVQSNGLAELDDLALLPLS
ncbi:hypothetical protein ABTN43_19730, partial [Acinetobacter baumannii]